MRKECIHKDRLAWAMSNKDKTDLGEALYWYKKLAKPPLHLEPLKLVKQKIKSDSNDPLFI